MYETWQIVTAGVVGTLLIGGMWLRHLFRINERHEQLAETNRLLRELLSEMKKQDD